MTFNSFIWLTSNFSLFRFSLRYPSTSGKVPELAGTQQMTVKWTNPTCYKNYLQEGTSLVKESPIINGLFSMEDHNKFISVSIFSQSILWSFIMRACSFGVLKTALKIPVQIYANYSSVSLYFQICTNSSLIWNIFSMLVKLVLVRIPQNYTAHEKIRKDSEKQFQTRNN